MGTESALVAFGDESLTSRPVNPSTYMLAGVIAEISDVPNIRTTAMGFRSHGQRKAHWHSDSEKQHEIVMRIISQMPIRSVIVVRVADGFEADERRRRKSLERFTFVL